MEPTIIQCTNYIAHYLKRRSVIQLALISFTCRRSSARSMTSICSISPQSDDCEKIERDKRLRVSFKCASVLHTRTNTRHTHTNTRHHRPRSYTRLHLSSISFFPIFFARSSRRFWELPRLFVAFLCCLLASFFPFTFVFFFLLFTWKFHLWPASSWLWQMEWSFCRVVISSGRLPSFLVVIWCRWDIRWGLRCRWDIRWGLRCYRRWNSWEKLTFWLLTDKKCLKMI